MRLGLFAYRSIALILIVLCTVSFARAQELQNRASVPMDDVDARETGDSTTRSRWINGGTRLPIKGPDRFALSMGDAFIVAEGQLSLEQRLERQAPPASPNRPRRSINKGLLIFGLALVAGGSVVVATTQRGWYFPVFETGGTPSFPPIPPKVDHLECRNADPGPIPDPSRRCSPLKRQVGLWAALAGAAATGGAFIR
jgi:hypothetical protein